MSSAQPEPERVDRETGEIQSPSVIAARGEVAIAQVAETSRRLVEAKYMMAERHPRDEDQARAAILRDCARPRFAAKARYLKPVGKGLEGLSVRFAEAAARHWKNLLVQTPVLYEDESKRISRVEVIDLEANITYSIDVEIEKTVERNSLREGQDALGTRTGAGGKTVYVVRATEDEMLAKMLAHASKIIRNGILRMLPVDIKEEAEALIIETKANRAATDPDGMKKDLIGDFMCMNIMPSDLREAGFDLDRLTPKDLDVLAGIIAGIEGGDTTWKEVLVARKDGDAEPAAAESATAKAKGAAAKAAAAAAPKNG